MDAYRLYRVLERRYDGELPQDLRRAACAGGRANFELAQRHAAMRCCDRQGLLARMAAAARRRDADLVERSSVEALAGSEPNSQY